MCSKCNIYPCILLKLSLVTDERFYNCVAFSSNELAAGCVWKTR